MPGVFPRSSFDGKEPIGVADPFGTSVVANVANKLFRDSILPQGADNQSVAAPTGGVGPFTMPPSSPPDSSSSLGSARASAPDLVPSRSSTPSHPEAAASDTATTLSDDALGRCVFAEGLQANPFGPDFDAPLERTAGRFIVAPAAIQSASRIATPSELAATGFSPSASLSSDPLIDDQSIALFDDALGRCFFSPDLTGPNMRAPFGTSTMLDSEASRWSAPPRASATPVGNVRTSLGKELPDPFDPNAFGALANSIFRESGPGAAAPVAATASARTGATGDKSNGFIEPASRLDVEALRADFPILHQRIHGKPLVWLDNAATTQKPRQVVERLRRFYYEDNSNVHRGAHTLAARATDSFEEARGKVARFLGAGSPQEIVFVRGTTDAINLVAASFGKLAIRAGDEIILSVLEHHSNIVPWQLFAREVGARIRVAPVDHEGNLLLEDYAALLNPRTRIVAMTQVSNAIGTVMPVREVTALAHRVGARVLIDGAQSVQHLPVNVQELGCDFFCFSGHKIFGPTGTGALFGKREVLEAMPPYQGGGSMIDHVTFNRTTYAPVPGKFEAGTGIIAGVVGLGAALDYVTQVGLSIIERHESVLMAQALEGLSLLRQVRVIGNPRHRAGAISFVVDGFDVAEIGALLDQEGIAVRSGHHCAQPALAHFGLTASVRPSFALYNTMRDVEALIEALERIITRSP